MGFRGLFVGIDFYESPTFNQLRFAKRDAIVLDALFADNMGGETTLLLDAEATKKKIVTEMRHLAEVSTVEDTVVIAFSGHGTSDGELALYEADPERLAETALSLDDFTELVGEIRARILIVALDCCFSGHAADKVLRVPGHDHTVRDGSPSRTKGLSELRRGGRIVLAAADKDQTAHEVASFRHGLLSHYLIEGLLGHPEVVENDEIPILKLAHFVMKNISSHERELSGKQQSPVVAAVATDFRLKRFVSGPRYRATADARKPGPVNWGLTTLTPYGIPDAILDVWGKDIKRLNRLQIAAVNDGGLLEGLNVLVSAPTSAGKTMVGELSAVRAVAEGKKAVFLLPTRALVHEQYERFQRLYGPLGYRSVRATGELRDQLSDLVSGRFELAVLTYEKFVGLVSVRPSLLDAGVLVVDEVQSLMLPDRGPLLETLLTWLKVRAGAAEKPQIVGLSAVLGEPVELARWLTANLVETTHRDVPLLEGVIGPDGLYRYRDQEGREAEQQLLEPEIDVPLVSEDRLVTRLVSALATDGQQVIVFRSTRGQARSLALSLARSLGLPAADSVLARFSGRDSGWTTDQLQKCLKGGVGFHISDLTTDERHLLETAFGKKGSQVRVLVATTTLAQGVNLAADAVVICELEHPAPSRRRYSVSEYRNMAGRAGRAGLVEQGRSFVVTRGSADADQKWRSYVKAVPEPIRSALSKPSVDPRTVLLSAFTEPAAQSGPASEADVARFMASTFAAHLSRADGSADPFPRAELRRMIDELVRASLLAESPKGLVLTALGKITARSGLSVESVATVVEALSEVPADLINRATLICAAQLTPELDDVRFSRISKTAYQEHFLFAKKLKERGAAAPLVSRLMGAPSRSGAGVAPARRSLACLLWSEGIPLNSIEAVINRPLRATSPGAPGPVQHAAQRSADVITTVIEIASHIHPETDLDGLPDLLPTQLELGIVEGLVPIAWKVTDPLPRHVYLNLTRVGLRSPAAILSADASHLLECVDGSPELRHILVTAATNAQEEAGAGSFEDLVPPPAV